METKQLLQYAIPLVIMGIVFTVRLKRMNKERPLDLKRFWVLPLLLVGIAIFLLARNPLSALGIVVCAIALAVGLAVGWHRGKMIQIHCDPATGKLTQTVSPAALMLLMGIVLLRFAVRSYFDLDASNGHLEGPALIATDALLLFGVGLVGMTRIEMAIRAKRILAGRESLSE